MSYHASLASPRLAAVIVGVLMILAAGLADELGLDHSPTFGTGETLLALAGVVLLLAGLLGSRLPAWYRDTAILLLNTLVLCILVELAAIALSTLGGFSVRTPGLADSLTEHYLALPYYAEQPWARQHWQEHEIAATKSYRPYVGWRRPPFSGQTIQVDEDGIRRTPGARCDTGAYRVFAFGGSTLWGWGAPDWGTLPACLQEELAARRSGPVCVVNFGESAYISTQSLIQLILRLTAGERPDLVIFYDGVNEVLAAHQSGRPMLHQNYREVVERFERPRHPLVEWLRGFSTFQLFAQLAGRFAPDSETPGRSLAETAALADEVVATYQGAHTVVGGLAAAYGFDYAFFWQPHLVVGEKPLTPEERGMLEGMDWVLELEPALVDLFHETYRRVATRAPEEEHLYDIADVFDQVEEQTWTDPYGHVTPQGNRIVALRMLEVLLQEESLRTSAQP